MQSIRVNIIIYFLIFTVLSMVFGFESIWASSSESEPAAENSKGQSDREWAKRTSKLNVHETKVKDLTKLLQSLIIKKSSNQKILDEKGQPVDVINKIAESHKELKETVATYNKEKDELKYRYPEEGQLIERRYVPLRTQSIEQIEKEIGLDAELTKTKTKIDKKYATFVGDEVVPPPKVQGPDKTLKEVKKIQDESKRIKLKK